MPIELTAHTEPGARLVALAERLSEEIAARAAEHDRDGSHPFEAIEALKAGLLRCAPCPVELGGLGSSAHDLVVASTRLARGDASVAIGVNMHLVAVLNMERRRQVAVAAGQERRAGGFAASLAQVARDGVVPAAAISEPGQDLTRPGTLATRTESGWRIDGRKLFCTCPRRHRSLRGGHVRRRRGHGALRVRHGAHRRARGRNARRLGRLGAPPAANPSPSRASSCPRRACAAASAPAIRCRRSATWWPGCSMPRPRSASPSKPTSSPAAVSPDASTATGGRAPRSPTTSSTSPPRARSSRERPTHRQHRAANPASDGSAREIGALFAEAQAAKAFVNEATARVVDRALALSGGAGYLNGSPPRARTAM